jgi:chemotaxis protein methyltransferase CheR
MPPPLKLQTSELKPWADLILQACGVNLDSTKGYLIEARLADMAHSLKVRSFTELLQRVRADRTNALLQEVIDRMTTNETSFFRDSSPFDLLRNKIFPELIDRRRGKGSVRLRIWSAACSTGQEIYSVAIILHELARPHSWLSAQLLGTDISNAAIGTASKGIFNKVEIERGLPPDQRGKYFNPQPDGRWKIADEIRAMVAFRHLNLLKEFSSLGTFDLILCRNVAIYFQEEAKKDLFNRLARSMAPDGVLLIGSTESITGLCPFYKSHRHLRSVFYTL